MTLAVPSLVMSASGRKLGMLASASAPITAWEPLHVRS
jgi:hypothetical protein